MPKTTDTHPLLVTYLTVEEIATGLRMDVETIRSYIRSGSLKAIRMGRQYRVSSIDYQDFLDERSTGH
ncbi:helix-turn-helix domain-containing protein [Paenibacillus sp. FSL R7-0302]|uniref:helix-turn-helix domain-containing protein n=1 Tax=Paenibacillus sp. FSL R7-0302 TaxID=2921681 RepID=UPI0030FC2D0B